MDTRTKLTLLDEEEKGKAALASSLQGWGI